MSSSLQSDSSDNDVIPKNLVVKSFRILMFVTGNFGSLYGLHSQTHHPHWRIAVCVRVVKQ